MKLIVAAAVVLTLTACGSDSEPGRTATSAELQQQACSEVREGVDAFNNADYAATVSHFKKAIAPATAFAKATPASNADDLLNAVRYYAGLQPREYPVAAKTSSDFAKYKSITLGQCVPSGEVPDDDEIPT